MHVLAVNGPVVDPEKWRLDKDDLAVFDISGGECTEAS
jgi:hypothetical protein